MPRKAKIKRKATAKRNHPARSFLATVLEEPSLRAGYVAAQLEVSVYALLSQAFKNAGITQADFGRRIGVSRARAHQILSGDSTNLTLDLMGRSAGALGLSWRLALADALTGESRFGLSSSAPVVDAVAKFTLLWRDAAVSQVVKASTPTKSHSVTFEELGRLEYASKTKPPFEGPDSPTKLAS